MQGIQIFNTANRLVISPDYLNYSIVEKGTISNTGTLPIESANRLILVRPSGGVGTVYGSSVGLLGISGQGSITNTTGARVKSTTGYLDYVILQIAPPKSASTNGLVVYRDDGAISFDAYYSGSCPVVTANTYQLQLGGSVFTASISGLPAVLSGRNRYVSTTSLFVHQYGLGNNSAWWFGTYATFYNNSSIEVGSFRNTNEAYLGYTISFWGLNLDKHFIYNFFDA